MAKRAIRLFGFGCLFTLLFSLLNLSMKAECQRWDNFYRIPRNSIDVLFIGNSHSFSSFQPQIVDKIIPVRSYVVGISAENIVVSYYELKEALNYQHPKVVVLETFTLDLDDTRDFGYIFGFLDAGKWNQNRFDLAKRYLTPETSYSIFPALRSRIDWERSYIYPKQLVDQLKNRINKEQPDLINSSIKELVINETAYRNAENSPFQEFEKPNPEIQIYLEKFYQLCQENDIQLVLTKAPIVNSTIKQSKYYKPFDASSFIEANNIPTIDYENIKFNHLHYSNETHTNGFGSVIISIETAKRLSQVMDLPIDDSALAYYQAFSFLDYKIYQEGDNFTFELVPFIENSPVEFQWIVKNREMEKLYESNWQKDNKVSFQLGPYRSFDVYVQIRNPHGDYEMPANFSISTKELQYFTN